MTTILLIIATILCVAYMGFSMLKGVPESLSATYYKLGRHGWVFQVYMVLMAVLMYAVWFPVCREAHHCLVFLACASLVFVAAAPCFRLRLEGMVHYSSAVVCCVCAVLWQVFNSTWVVPLVCFLAIIYPMIKDKKYMWWLEIATIVSAYVSLMFF